MKKAITIVVLICIIIGLVSCADDREIIPEANDIREEKTPENIPPEATGDIIITPVQIKENEPRDIINGFPLYIEFEEEFVMTDEWQEAKKFYHTSNCTPSIAIAYAGGRYKTEIYDMQYCWEENKDKLGRQIFRIYGEGKEEIVIYCSVYTFWSRPRQALIITDSEGSRHLYLFGIDGENEKLTVEKAEISKPRRGNQSIIDMIDEETVNVKFFSYDWENFADEYNVFDKEYYKYETEAINVNNFVDEFIEFMDLHTGMIVDDMWFEGKTLFVDFNEIGMRRFRGYGTSGAMDVTMRTLLTLASIPNVERIRLLTDGENGFGGAHFPLGPIFNASNYQ